MRGFVGAAMGLPRTALRVAAGVLVVTATALPRGVMAARKCAGVVRYGSRASRMAGAALAALISIGGGQAFASAGCDAVNLGSFNASLSGGSTTNTVRNFAIGDKISFIITSGAPNPLWELTGANNAVLDSTTSSGTQTRSYTVTGANNDTTLTELLVDPGGGSVSVTAACLAAAPTVTNVSPNSGPAAGGTSVTITGTNFTGATAVKFGSTNATSFTVNSSTSITATSPAGTGTVDITVTTSGGTSATSAADQFSYQGTTSVSIASSVNPSSVGQAVTFTARVTSGSGTPTGIVTFADGGTTLGTATLVAGVATFTTSSLALGTHAITASYAGSGNFLSGTAGLTQLVQTPLDSARLRALQVQATKIEALASGSALMGAVDDAINEGFSECSASVRPNSNGVYFNLQPDAAPPGCDVEHARRDARRDSGQGLPPSVRSFAPDTSIASGRIDDAMTALAFAKPAVTKEPPAIYAAPPKEWLAWADVRGTGWFTDQSAGDIRGGQINALVGLTRRLTPDFLVGVLSGYENFNYTSQTLNGRLKGDGWTVGGYLGWRFWPGLRFDAAVGRSGISYNDVSGAAAGSFPGNRWIASAGLIGTYRSSWLEIEPSAKVYAIWERDSSYIDSLGTVQADNVFSTGRASAGFKVAYPMLLWSTPATLSPYVGLYADYYFSSDNAALLLPTTFVQGWAARTTAGVSYNAPGGAKLSLGGEVSGLGNQTFTTWSVRGRAAVPF